jgi:Zn-dependent protease/predicted transcriptional regulator
VGETFRLGSVAGIRIGLNWSWLVVFALIAWTLAASVFPDQNPGLSDGTYLAMAIAAAVLFFVSLLLHELGHAVVARREGMEIEGITLWLFGGVAKFKGMFPSAGAEFRIAIAGPLVSLVIGLIFVAVAAMGNLPTEVDGVAAWLGFINLILLVFNLLPALPLDGGRVLRAALWRARGDFGWATRVAADIGRGFGYLFIALGLFEVFFLSSFAGVWLAFLGWFLLGAAGAEAGYLATRQVLDGLRVRDLMVRDPVTITPEASIGRFMDDVVWAKRHTTYPVVDDGRAVGLVPFRCVAEVPRREWDNRSIEDCMLGKDEVPVLHEDDELVDALEQLGQSPVGRALVLDGDRLVGLLSMTDLVRALEAGPPARPRGRQGRLSRSGQPRGV